MTSNKLKLNNDKTHLLVLMTSKKRKNRTIYVKITTPTEIIEPSSCETLLGCVIHEDMKWAHYILHGNPAPDGQKSLVSQLNSRLNGLRMISRVASFKTRLMVTNGIFASKLSYVIPLYSGCENYLVNSLQIIQNKAARFVNKCDRFTSVKSLLSQCGWLSVYQLGVYHSILIIYKTIQIKRPEYLHDKISTKFPYQTRIVSTNILNLGPDPKMQMTRNSFRWRATNLWNNLPEDLRLIPKISHFKKKLKLWVSSHVGIHP